MTLQRPSAPAPHRPSEAPPGYPLLSTAMAHVDAKNTELTVTYRGVSKVLGVAA